MTFFHFQHVSISSNLLEILLTFLICWLVKLSSTTPSFFYILGEIFLYVFLYFYFSGFLEGMETKACAQSAILIRYLLIFVIIIYKVKISVITETLNFYYRNLESTYNQKYENNIIFLLSDFLT